ncbi:MAG: hypothetical protein ACOCWY_00440 [Thermodesulfobacteriota bacterium]
MKPKRCEACGNEFEPPAHKASRKYCDRPECQEAKVQKRKTRENVRRIAKPDDWDHFPAKPLRKTAIRACRSCGKDAYPNYFFCPACHHRVCGGDLEECGQWEENLSW